MSSTTPVMPFQDFEPIWLWNIDDDAVTHLAYDLADAAFPITAANDERLQDTVAYGQYRLIREDALRRSQAAGETDEVLNRPAETFLAIA